MGNHTECGVLSVEVIDRFRAAQFEDRKSKLTVCQTLTKFNSWLFESGRDINNLTRHDVQSYINYLDADGISASTITRHLQY